MKAQPISIDLAYRLRFHACLALPIGREYVDERVAEIADRQHALMQEHQELDDKLLQLHKGEIE